MAANLVRRPRWARSNRAAILRIISANAVRSPCARFGQRRLRQLDANQTDRAELLVPGGLALDPAPMPAFARHDLIACGAALWLSGLAAQLHSLAAVTTYAALSALNSDRRRALSLSRAASA